MQVNTANITPLEGDDTAELSFDVLPHAVEELAAIGTPPGGAEIPTNFLLNSKSPVRSASL